MREASKEGGERGRDKGSKKDGGKGGTGEWGERKKGRKSRCPDHILGSILSEFLRGRTTQASVFFKAPQMILMCS